MIRRCCAAVKVGNFRASVSAAVRFSVPGCAALGRRGPFRGGALAACGGGMAAQGEGMTARGGTIARFGPLRLLDIPGKRGTGSGGAAACEERAATKGRSVRTAGGARRLRRFGRSAMDSGPLPPTCRGGQLGRLELGRAEPPDSTGRAKGGRRFGRAAMDSGPLPPVCRGGQLERT